MASGVAPLLLSIFSWSGKTSGSCLILSTLTPALVFESCSLLLVVLLGCFLDSSSK